MKQAKKDYIAWVKEEPAPVLITEEDCRMADGDTAVYVTAGNSGEGADRFEKEGDYLPFAEEYDLIQSAARDEWGFAGVVMTDWFTS